MDVGILDETPAHLQALRPKCVPNVGSKAAYSPHGLELASATTIKVSPIEAVAVTMHVHAALVGRLGFSNLTIHASWLGQVLSKLGPEAYRSAHQDSFCSVSFL